MDVSRDLSTAGRHARHGARRSLVSLLAWLLLAGGPQAALAAAAAATPSTPGGAAVQVRFIDPQTYTDDGRADASPSEDPERIHAELAAILQQAGAQCLAPGQTVHIDVTDIRLAGTLEPRPGMRFHPTYRLMRDAAWPAVELDYRLNDAQGRQQAAGHERVADLDYLRHAAFMTAVDTHPLPYERYMLQRWFRQRICSAGQPQPD